MADELLESSVQRKPSVEETGHMVLQIMGAFKKDLPPWWSPRRDAFFRDFWKSENILASAIYSITGRNAAFGWKLSGLPDDVKDSQWLLQSADFGGGWQQLISKTTEDFLTSDNGAFWEIIRPSKVTIDGLTLPAVKQYFENNERAEWFAIKKNGKKIRLRGRNYKLFDSPLDLPIGIAHFDSAQIQRTGDPEIPAIYTDRDGHRHRLRWWQVISFVDMPSPIESMNGLGFCSVSRIFEHAHTLRSLATYKDEKLSGRFARAIHITNANPQLIQDQMNEAKMNASNANLTRYSQPVIASTFDPGVVPTVATINLANMPDGFKEEITLEWYVSTLALALGVDYGFLAPLPGKGLGTASQSETMAKQSRGKSSRLFMDMTSNAINFRGLLPSAARFSYVERDTDQEMAEENVKKARAETRFTMIKSGEISAQIARQIATDSGDLSNKYLQAMGEEDMVPGIEVDGDDNLEAATEVLDSVPDIPVQPQFQEEETGTGLAKGLNIDENKSGEDVRDATQAIGLVTKISNAARQAFRKK